MTKFEILRLINETESIGINTIQDLVKFKQTFGCETRKELADVIDVVYKYQYGLKTGKRNTINEFMDKGSVCECKEECNFVRNSSPCKLRYFIGTCPHEALKIRQNDKGVEQK